MCGLVQPAIREETGGLVEKLATWWKVVLLTWLALSFKMCYNPNRAEALPEGITKWKLGATQFSIYTKTVGCVASNFCLFSLVAPVQK